MGGGREGVLRYGLEVLVEISGAEGAVIAVLLVGCGSALDTMLSSPGTAWLCLCLA
jgi:hypothetical protein